MSEHIIKEKADVGPIDILLVEDNEADVKITLRAFSKAHLRNNIYVVNDGQEALDFIRNEGEYSDKDKYPRPGLILLDINMPKVDGFEVLKTLKSDSNYNTIPVIMLTSSKDEEDVVKSYYHGASSFVSKPVVYEDFVEMIDSFNLYWHIVSKLPPKK